MEERRKSLIAIRSVQVPMILQAVLLSFILINLVLIAAFLVGGGLGNPPGRLYLALAVAAVEIVCLLGVFVMARKQSNRLVGPIYRISELGARLKDGDLTARLDTREGDYFADQLGILDEAVSELHDRIHAIKGKLETLENDQRSQALDEVAEDIKRFRTEDNA